ncbi:MAG: hypothetical protein ACLGH3_10245 [Actinomycetota bacterium]
MSEVGLSHIEIYVSAFWASSSSDIEALAADARDRGVTILYQDRSPEEGAPSAYALFLEDPDRMKIEVVLNEGPELA